MYPKHVQNFLQCYEIQHPIVQAPMAGGITTVDLVASVSQAGGIGSFGAAYMSPEQLDDDIKKVKNKTSKPFSANLFCFEMPTMPSWDAENPAIEKYLELFTQYEMELPTQYPLVNDLYSKQLAVVIRHQVPIVSFTFGVPDKEVINTIQAYGGKVWITVTNLLEAKQAQIAGADALILQGYEAGGHRASFNPDAKTSEQIGLISLLQLIADSIDIPFIASGGLMTGKSIFASMVLGAVAGQLGTAFLGCEEAQLTSSWREALVGAGGTDTVLTRSFSGRLARGIVNKHTRIFEKVESQIPPFPYINAMTGPLRTWAKKADSCDHQSLWAGQSCSLARFMTAANLLELLSREIKQAASF